MKVLIVFNHPAPYKVRLFNELAKYMDLEVIFEREKASNRPDAFYNAKDFNFKYQILKHGAFGEENSFSGELKNIIKKRHHEFDLIIMNGYRIIAELRAIKYMNKHHIPFTLYINGGIIREKESFFKKRFKTKFISSATNYFSPCEEADEYLVHYGANRNNIYHYVYSTVYEKDILDKPLNKSEKEKIRLEQGLPLNKLFISAGQFIKRKNNIQIIDCFQHIESSLLLVGEGKQLNLYNKFIKENNIKNIHILPFKKRESLFELLKASDGFITLSSEDIYGHTINEAFSMGIPVLSSNKVVASRHLIKEGKNGYLVDLNNNGEIIYKINHLVEDCSSQEAILTAKENTIEKMVSSMVEIIKKVSK